MNMGGEDLERDALERGPYEDGFSMRTVIGALFVALVMMPGAIYMGLVAGQSLGAAAEWVTIILFAELARRSFTQLKRQEVYVLFYVASGIAAVTVAHLALSGGPFAGAIWHQYLLQSPETSTIAAQIPDWVVPPASSPAIRQRNLAHADWWWSRSSGLLSPLGLIAIGYVVGRLCFFGMGYLLFRLTSDHERLPFPMAPIAAEGATALAESTEREAGAGGRRESWRRRVFSVGACLGILFGALYVLLPVVSGLFLTKPIMLFPIPFVDFTPNVESWLPGSLISLSFDAAIFLAGMILPFRMVLGTFVAMVATNVIGGPLLVKLGAFRHWQPGNGLLVNQMVLGFDFWLSVSIGVALAVLIVGLGVSARVFAKRWREGRGAPAPAAGGGGAPGEPLDRAPSRERGDFPVWIAVLLFLSGTTASCLICRRLVPEFPFWIVVLFGFVWAPLHSYISARLIGLTGSGLATPFLRETVFIASGYQKVDIWFAPLPMGDYGGAAQRFRALELTRTRFTSIIKAELLMLPVVFVSSFLFWWFFWHIQQVPSASFPFAARVWPIAARQAYLIFTANTTESPLLLQALNPRLIAGGAAVGLLVYGGLAWAGVPAVFFYGLIGGLGAPSHVGINILVGALLGRLYFARKFGAERWRRYVPVVVAGFSCGMGLAGMTGVAISLIVHCVQELPF